MFPRWSMIANALLTVACCAGQAGAESVEDVMKQIHAKVSALKSMQYKNTMVMDSDSPGFELKTDSHSSMEAVNKGATWLMRFETKLRNTQKMAGSEQVSDTVILMICDGTYVYRSDDMMGHKTATKRNADTLQNPFDAMAGFKRQEPTTTFKLLPDEKVDGKPCWVIEQSPRDPNSATTKSLVYYDKASGLTLKAVSYGKDGKIQRSFVTTDIKLNEKIPPDRFEFKVPAGVTLQDMTAKPPSTDDKPSKTDKK